MAGLLISSLKVKSYEIFSKTETLLSELFFEYYKVLEFPQQVIL